MAAPNRRRTSRTTAKARERTRTKVRAHRERMRKMGLRPIQIWVPDVTSPAFIKEARRQSLLIANDPEEADIMAWLESVQDWSGWDEQ
jgi:hypothetical protein